MTVARWFSRNIGTLVDLAVLGGAWGVGVGGVVEAFDDYLASFILLLSAPVNALYLQIRLTPQLAALADAGRREELAVTPLSAREYLWPRLKWPLLLAVAPAATLIFPFSVVLLVSSSYPGIFFDLLMFNCLSYAVLLISVAGALDLFARLCQRQSPPGAALFLIPMAWCLAAVGPPLGFYFSAFLLNRWVSGDAVLVYLTLAGVGLGVGAIVIAVRRWKTACRLYYRFD